MKRIVGKDQSFEKLGEVIGYDALSEADRDMMATYYEMETEAPKVGNIYVADDANIHNLPCIDKIKALHPSDDVQVGYCHGNSTKVNAMEWHDSEEVIFAATDCVLYLGAAEDLMEIEGHKSFDTDKIVALQLKKNDCVRLWAKVLHFAPIRVNETPYKTMILLPKGTNTPLDSKGETHLFMKNKWIIAHKDRQDLVDQGVWPGVVGINYDWNDM